MLEDPACAPKRTSCFENCAIGQHHGREPHDVRLALQGPQDQRVVHVAVRNLLATRDVREARLSRRRVERFRCPPLRRTYYGGASHHNTTLVPVERGDYSEWGCRAAVMQRDRLGVPWAASLLHPGTSLSRILRVAECIVRVAESRG